ncbi:MAG: chemotaxis protein CheX, partial [Bacillota bacterium]
MFKAGLINPFLDAAYKFLQTELSMEVTRGQLRLESSKSTSGEVNVALGVAGDAEGTVIYSMSEKTAKAIAAAFESGMVSIN